MKENRSEKMATWPVGKLLFSMGLPAVFSMLIQAMYNVVDSIFISNYSQDALFAMGLVTPLQMVSLSIALGLGTGVGTFVSRRLGEGKKDEAIQIANTGLQLGIFHVLIVIFMGIFLTKPFLHLFTSRPEIIDLGYQYLFVVMVFCAGQHIAMLFERTLQAQGNMIVPMFSLLTGAITNIILDPIMIFGFFGCPEMGIKGAAIATVTGQFASLIVATIALFKGKNEVRVSFSNFEVSPRRIKEIYQIGIPTTIMNMIGSLTTTLMNNVLVRFSEEAVSSLSVYFKLQSFVFMPVFGFNQGALPILSYNYGARNKERYLASAKYFLGTAVTIMTCGMLLFQFGTHLLLSSFGMSGSLEAIATVTLRTISLAFIPTSISIVITTVLQSFGKGVLSMIQSILRQIGVLIPVAYFLSQFGLNYVWFAYPIAEIIILCIFIPIAIKTYKTQFND